MRIFEVFCLLASTPVLGAISLSVRKWPSWLRMMPLLAVTLAVAHIRWEGYRWQMIPGYVLTAGLLLADSRSFCNNPFSRVAGWVGWVLLCSSIALCLVFPIIEFPTPSGKFAIGTTVRHLVDTSRQETLSVSNHGSRELMVQIWYPAEPFSGRAQAPYVLDQKQISAFIDSHRMLLKTQARLDAVISGAQQNYPLLIYAPSWHGERYQNTFLFSELASHGFIVVAIDHPYGSAITAFPDGRVVRAELSDFTNASSEKALQRSIENIERQMRVRSRDVIFVLDELARYNSEDSKLFKGRLDLDRVGVFGFSFGGAVAAEACWLDPRFKAGIDMDGDLYGDVAENGVKQPFLFMDETLDPPAESELKSQNPNIRRNAELDDRARSVELRSVERFGGYRLAIAGTEHDNFTDSPLLSPLRYLTGVGTINRYRSMQILATYTLTFFQEYLDHLPMPLLNGNSADYPEVRLEATRPRQAGLINSSEHRENIRSQQ